MRKLKVILSLYLLSLICTIGSAQYGQYDQYEQNEKYDQNYQNEQPKTTNKTILANPVCIKRGRLVHGNVLDSTIDANTALFFPAGTRCGNNNLAVNLGVILNNNKLLTSGGLCLTQSEVTFGVVQAIDVEIFNLGDVIDPSTNQTCNRSTSIVLDAGTVVEILPSRSREAYELVKIQDDPLLLVNPEYEIVPLNQSVCLEGGIVLDGVVNITNSTTPLRVEPSFKSCPAGSVLVQPGVKDSSLGILDKALCVSDGVLTWGRVLIKPYSTSPFNQSELNKLNCTSSIIPFYNVFLLVVYDEETYGGYNQGAYGGSGYEKETYGGSEKETRGGYEKDTYGRYEKETNGGYNQGSRTGYEKETYGGNEKETSGGGYAKDTYGGYDEGANEVYEREETKAEYDRGYDRNAYKPSPKSVETESYQERRPSYEYERRPQKYEQYLPPRNEYRPRNRDQPRRFDCNDFKKHSRSNVRKEIDRLADQIADRVNSKMNKKQRSKIYWDKY